MYNLTCLLRIPGQSETSYIVPVIILNNSLGVPLLPKTIDCEDFESTLEKTDKKETLNKWYKLDDDAEPPCYTLQSIEQHIPNFDVKYDIFYKFPLFHKHLPLFLQCMIRTCCRGMMTQKRKKL